VADGTVVADSVDYALPFGPLGRMMNWLIVENQLKKIFNFRQAAIISLLGGQVTEVEKPLVFRAVINR
jgi:ligand-binding SRPBCC domain-containing protein